MNLTEKDFIDKMIEIANDGHEYMDQLECVKLFLEIDNNSKVFYGKI